MAHSAGTYFPKDAFIEKLGAIVSINERDPDKINDYATSLQEACALFTA